MDIPGSLRLHSFTYEKPELTVGELRKMSNTQLWWYPNIGKVTIAKVREFFGPHQELDAASPADIPNVVRELRTAIAGLEERVARLEA